MAMLLRKMPFGMISCYVRHDIMLRRCQRAAPPPPLEAICVSEARPGLASIPPPPLLPTPACVVKDVTRATVP